MKKNKKEIHYGEEGVSIPDLLKKIDREDEKQREQARIKQVALEKDLVIAFKREEELKETIATAREIAEKMQDDYLGLEAKIGKEKLAEIEKESLRKKDVLAGKASIRDFVREGKREDQIANEAIEKTAAELEQGLNAIHEKGKEILELKDTLGECRNRIRGLIIQPLRFRQESLKTLKEYTEEQIGGYSAEMEIYRTEWDRVKTKLQLIKKGVSLSSGYTWEAMSPIDAQRIIFSPIIPLDCIAQLKSELEKYRDADRVVVSYSWRSHEINVRPYYKPLPEKEKTIETESAVIHKVRMK